MMPSTFAKRKKNSEKKELTSSSTSRMKLRNAMCYCERTVKCVATFELYELQQTNKFTDRTLQSEDGAVFNIHTIVMSSLSHDFRDMMPEQTHHCLPYSTEVISTIVELAYTGATTTKESILEEQLQMAAHYGITLLTKICSDFVVSTLTVVNWHKRYRLGQKFLCKHTLEQIKMFICANFTKLNNVVELLTVEDMETVLKREDVNCTTERLLLILNTCVVFKSLPDHQKSKLTDLISAVSRKPPDVLISVGGWDSAPADKVEVFNCLSNTWIQAPAHIKLPVPLAYHGMEVINNRVYTIGGYSDLATEGTEAGYRDNLFALDLGCLHKGWTEMSFMLSKRCYVATANFQSRLVALGGHDGISRLRSAEIYDPGTNQWDPLPDMLEIRSDFSAVTHGSRVFAIGGFNGTDVLAEVEQFNFEEQTWTRYTSLVTPRSGTRSIVYEDKVYVLGGYDGTSRLRSVECFTPGPPGTRPRWHQVADMLEPRSNFSVAVIDDRLMVMGGYRQEAGEGEGSVCNLVDIYCSATNSWTRAPELLTARSALACVQLPRGDIF